jgi:hypothetical protein
MAWDAVSPGKPYLWLWSQDGWPLVQASQLDPAMCDLTGVAFTGHNIGEPLENQAGGAALSIYLIPGKIVLLGAHQAQPDTLMGYDLQIESQIFLPVIVR